MVNKLINSSRITNLRGGVKITTKNKRSIIPKLRNCMSPAEEYPNLFNKNEIQEKFREVTKNMKRESWPSTRTLRLALWAHTYLTKLYFSPFRIEKHMNVTHYKLLCMVQTAYLPPKMEKRKRNSYMKIQFLIWNGRRTKIQLSFSKIKETTWSQPPLVFNRTCWKNGKMTHFSLVKGQYSSIFQLVKIRILQKLKNQSDCSCRWKRKKLKLNH